MNKRPLVPLDSFVSGYRKALPVFPVILALLGLTYFFALRESFDYTIGHFETGAFWFVLVIILSVLAAVVSAVPAFMAKYTVSVTDTPENNLCAVFASVMGAVLAVILSADSILAFTPETTIVTKLAAFTLPFMALSLIFGILPMTRGTWLHQLCSIPAVLSVNLTMFECYFDPAVPINSPVRNLTTIMQSALLLFLLSEARLSFGVKSWRITVPYYIFSGGTAVTLAGGTALGGILNRLLTAEPADPNLSVLRLGLYLALALLAVSRLFALPKVCGKYVEPPKKEKDKAKADEEIPAETDAEVG